MRPLCGDEHDGYVCVGDRGHDGEHRGVAIERRGRDFLTFAWAAACPIRLVVDYLGTPIMCGLTAGHADPHRITWDDEISWPPR